MLAKFVEKQFLDQLKYIDYGHLCIITPDGKEHHFYGQSADIEANVAIHDWKVVNRLASKGDIGLAECYRDGLIDIDDLVNLFIIVHRNEGLLGNYVYGNLATNIVSQLLYWFRSNTLSGSRKNIHAHYDVGNDFYSLWLDPTMTYSSALFAQQDDTLEVAQYRKYDRIIERLQSNRGNLLEIGCGWGGFAERAAQTTELDIKGITISKQQHEYAHKRLDGTARVNLEDYRNQQGKYDHIVSIEMFEAVGEKYWPVYFQKMKQLLADKGKAVVQTITIDDNHFKRYRKTGDMIRTFIFPGGMLPSVSRFKEEAHKAGLKVTDCFAFGKDYARTLKHWLQAFEQQVPTIRNMQFDEKFIRIWRFYLAICITGFAIGRTNVIQADIEHA